MHFRRHLPKLGLILFFAIYPACNFRYTQVAPIRPIPAGNKGVGPSPSAEISPTSEPSSPPSPIAPSGAKSGQYKNLVWNDEFTGTGGVDLTKWNVEGICDGGGNNEWQCYKDNLDNVSKDGQGNLVIQVIKNSYTVGGYTSGKITTRGKADWTYGRFESRIKIAAGKGFWPAFWMMPKDSVYGIWPTSGEIDIMEILGVEPIQTYSVLQYGKPPPFTKAAGGHKGPDYSQDFHVFACERDAKEIRFSMDEIAFLTVKDTDRDFWDNTQWKGQTPPDGAMWPYNQPFYLILNHAMGGDWPGAPDESIKFGKMYIDYVRVFQ